MNINLRVGFLYPALCRVSISELTHLSVNSDKRLKAMRTMLTAVCKNKVWSNKKIILKGVSALGF